MAPMLQASYEEKIQQALSKYLNTPIKVTITAKTHTEPSPQKQKEINHDNKKNDLKNRLTSEQPVKKIMETFDAIVIKESIDEK